MFLRSTSKDFVNLTESLYGHFIPKLVLSRHAWRSLFVHPFFQSRKGKESWKCFLEKGKFSTEGAIQLLEFCNFIQRFLLFYLGRKIEFLVFTEAVRLFNSFLHSSRALHHYFSHQAKKECSFNFMKFYFLRYKVRLKGLIVNQ